MGFVREPRCAFVSGRVFKWDFRVGEDSGRPREKALQWCLSSCGKDDAQAEVQIMRLLF